MARILAVTREMLAEVGHEGIVTADVARRCGISEAMIYKYFPTKRDLLIQVAVQWFEEMLRQYQPTPKGQGAFEALRQVTWHSLSAVRRAPALTRYVLLELRSDPSYRQMPIFQVNRQFTNHVTEVLREGIKHGELRDDVPLALLRDMIFGCIEHETWAFLRGEGDFSVDDVAEGIATVVYRGMRVPSPEERVGQADALVDTARRLERVAARLELVAPPRRNSRAP